MKQEEQYQEALSNGEKWAVKQYIGRVFGKDAKIITAVFTAESGLDCESVGDKHLKYIKNGVEYGASYGIAQIRHLPGRPKPESLLNCTFNIQYAKQVFDKEGLKPWSAFLNSSYLQYLE